MIKKLLFVFLLITLTAFHKNATTVFICGAEGAKKYHYSSSCRGLTACKQVITESSKNQAESFGLTLCGWED